MCMTPGRTWMSLLMLVSWLCWLWPVEAQEPATQEPVPQQAELVPAQLPVLGYGSFSAAEGMPGIPAVTFLAQMTYLKEQGIIPVSLQQFISWHRGECALPERSVLITLDEADAATYTVAFPVLRQMGFPFVIFADGRNLQEGTSYVGPGRLHAMRQAGGSIGSRSMTRPQACDWVFASESGPEASFKLAERELGVSAQRITAHFGSCEAFSYPRGYANADMMENLAIYGYRAAFSRREGKVTRQTPAYMLTRYMVRDMEAFARAVNFGNEGDDAAVLQQVREVAARQVPGEQSVALISPVGMPQGGSTLRENAAAHDAQQPPLPPVVELDPATLADVAVSSGEKELCIQEDEEAPAADLKDPVLEPRPVSQLPASGVLERRGGTGDWVTREFSRPLVPREQTRVAVLGYHDFSNTRPATEMCLRTAEFCQQLQYIQDAGISVITMQDFREWLLGSRQLPERCVLITIDDGWVNVYTEAFPVLQAYGYPFTLYLYTDFLGGKGLSMSQEVIREMMDAGATIGSHSASHPYPSKWKALPPESQEYAAMMQRELPDSVAKLRDMFGQCTTFCYPGGYHTPDMLESLRSCGVDVAFTVLEKKVTTQENPLLVHRYMVFGNDPRIFRRAVNFDDVAGVKPTAQGITEARERARAFFPKAFEKLGTPRIPVQEKMPEVKAAEQPHVPAIEKKTDSPIPVLEDIPEPEYSSFPA